MADRFFRLDRRELLAGLGAAALTPVAALDRRPPRRGLAWPCKPRPGIAPCGRERRIRRSGRWGDVLSRSTFKRGDKLEVDARKRAAGARGSELARDRRRSSRRTAGRSGAAGGRRPETSLLPLRHAGTFLCDLRLLGDGQARPSPALPADRRGKRAGRRRPRRGAADRRLAAAAGWHRDRAGHRSRRNARRSTPSTWRRSTSQPAANERLRLRFINGCQRTVIAIKIEGHEVRVMAIDGQPAEPFPARGGALVLAPGSRADVFVDATAAPGSTSAILLHDGKEARPIGRLVDLGRAAGQGPRRACPLRRCPPMACRSGSTSRARCASIWRLAAAERLGGAGEFHRDRAARLPRQDRPHRGAGPDQPRRDRHRVPSPWPSFPPARPARRWLEAVLAGYVGDRARADPADRVFAPNLPAAG